jgi:hypothetical protein
VAFSLTEAENIKLKDHFEKSKRNTTIIDSLCKQLNQENSILKEKTVKFKEFVENSEKFVRTLYN